MHNKTKRNARIVGALFLIAMVTSLVGAGLIEPILGTPPSFPEISGRENLVLTGVLLELTNGLAVLGIAFLLYPILRKVDESLATGYVTFRIIESGIIVAAVITPLVALSREFTATAPGTYGAVGTALIAVRANLTGQLLGIFFSLGAFVLYGLLYRSQLVPRFISIWGLLAAVLIFAWNLLELIGVGIEFGMVLALPIILNEIFLGIWLLARGFDRPVAAVGAARPAIGAR